LKPSKKGKETDPPVMASPPTGETADGASKEDDGDDEDLGATTQDDGPIENLMEKGKKISLDDFQMLKVIGRGSFGKVYLVRHKESEKPFALKILKKD